MLRDGSGGARRCGDAGADGRDAAGAAAELFATRPAPDCHVGAGSAAPDARRPSSLPRRIDPAPEARCPDQSGPPAGSDGAEPLSLSRKDAGALAELGRDGLLGVLGDIERLANRLAGYRAEVLGALEVLSQSGAAPDASPHLSLRDAAGVSERDARRMLRAAGKAREHRDVLEALSGGDINTAQAEALCDARVPDAVRAELVVAAGGEDTDATRRRVRQAESEHSIETAAERFERQRRARGAGWQRDHEGMLRLWAKLDAVAGAQVEANLEALRRQYWLDDKQVHTTRRTPTQRDADVLAYALAGITLTDADAAAVERLHARARWDAHRPERLAADEGRAANRRLPPAQISVLIGLDALRHRTDEMGLTDAGIELPPEVVRRLACDAELIPMTLGGPGGSADVGRSRRTVSLRLRRLLIARDRHCRWPGCHEPPSRCDAHHVCHWLDGGPTDLANRVLLCHRHHRHLHEHGYRMVLQPDGAWTTAQDAETGSVLATLRSNRQPRGP